MFRICHGPWIIARTQSFGVGILILSDFVSYVLYAIFGSLGYVYINGIIARMTLGHADCSHLPRPLEIPNASVVKRTPRPMSIVKPLEYTGEK